MHFDFLELVPLNFWVDELEEILYDVVALIPMSQLLVLVIFLKDYDFARNYSLADLYLTDSNEVRLSRGVIFSYSSCQ